MLYALFCNHSIGGDLFDFEMKDTRTSSILDTN